MMNLLRNLSAVALVALVALSGCKSSKPDPAANGRTEIVTPFSGPQYRSDDQYFRAVGQGASPQQQMSERLAEQDARRKIAGEVETLVKDVLDSYAQQYDAGTQQEFNARTEGLTRTVVETTLKSTRIKDSKMYQEKDGRYTSYIFMEMPAEQTREAMGGQISKDDKLSIDYDRQKFEEVFNKEMEELKKERQGK